MNAISISVRLRIFSNFFKKSRALPEVFYARRWPEVSRFMPQRRDMKASNDVAELQ
jgi:hypothetical protein